MINVCTLIIRYGGMLTTLCCNKYMINIVIMNGDKNTDYTVVKGIRPIARDYTSKPVTWEFTSI